MLCITIFASSSIRKMNIQNTFLHGTLSKKEISCHRIKNTKKNYFIKRSYNYKRFLSQHIWVLRMCVSHAVKERPHKISSIFFFSNQVPWAWFSRWSNKLVALGFNGSCLNTSLRIYKNELFMMYILRYVIIYVYILLLLLFLVIKFINIFDSLPLWSLL